MRLAVAALCLVYFALPLRAAGLDEAVISSDPSSAVDKLLQRAGFTEIQKSYALVVGIHEFDDFEPLPTERDPLSMRDYLVDEAGFDYVHILTGDKVTKERLEELMLDVFAELVKETDRFLLYWSGHGHTIGPGNSGRGFLPVKDSDRTKRSSMISMQNIRFWDSFINARQVLYLMDACYSGLIGSAPQSDLARITREQLAGPARHVITAGNRDEQTIAIDRLGGSIFTHALLKGLRGEADSGNVRGKDGLVTVGELRKYLGEEITELREYYGWERTITPQVRDMRGSDGAFFFPVPAVFPEAPAPQPEPPPASPVKEVQQALKKLGYDPGPETGEMSFQTRAALIAFQRQNGLVETGKLDAPTLDAIPFALAALVKPQSGVPARPQESEPREEEVVVLPLVEAPAPVQEPRPQEKTVALPQVETPTVVKSCEYCPELVRVEGEGRLEDFYIAKTEVTIEQYLHYLEDIGVADPKTPRDCYAWTADNRMRKSASAVFSQQAGADGDFPAACVSRQDAAGYIAWLNEKDPGTSYRLPTEAEYEFLLERQFTPYDIASTGELGGDGRYTCEIGNFGDSSSQFKWRNNICDDGHPGPAPVASFAAHGNGLYDLAGNLWEWAAECWRDEIAAAAQTEGCKIGTVRGGSFDDPVKNAVPGVRQPVPAKQRQVNIGFRVARAAK